MRPDDRVAGAVARLALTALLAACSNDPFESLEYGRSAVAASLAGGVDPDRTNARGDSLIHLAATFSDVDSLRMLLARGANARALDAGGKTALNRALEAGCTDCVLLLLQAHSDPDWAVGPRADRPLHLAARRGSPEMVGMLLDFGADPNARDGWGETPLHAAALADMYKAVLISRLLIDKGADPRLADQRGDTPLHKAALYDTGALVPYLASVGVDLNALNAFGATPLDRAIERHHDLAAEALYRMGARVALTKEFEPPLVNAARLDDVNRTLTLLAFGADPAFPFDGKLAIDVARDNGSDEVVAVLARPANRR